jgi:methylated-DNA-[protein]-cysteine S-methyltransferase
MEVWELLLKIPYGSITTYGDLAKQIAQQRGISRMSAQAVGGAVGSNPVSIIVPCHRVVGTNGNLTGFASGLDNKIALLKQEGHDMSKFSMPR